MSSHSTSSRKSEIASATGWHVSGSDVGVGVGVGLGVGVAVGVALGVGVGVGSSAQTAPAGIATSASTTIRIVNQRCFDIVFLRA
jgi:hypothetical protein